ncbi:MAG: NAD(P)H dehydrogenase assembly family protein, partial [Cyanobacteria bacterium P01_C01_bin.70]
MSTPFAVGDRVRLVTALPYVKTADTMPMLRPGDLLTVDNVGIIREQKPGNTW